jgi:hypothetical protein
MAFAQISGLQISCINNRHRNNIPVTFVSGLTSTLSIMPVNIYLYQKPGNGYGQI